MDNMNNAAVASPTGSTGQGNSTQQPPQSNIFKDLSSRMIKGLMIHDQLNQYFLFLNLPGYSMCQKYHYIKESINYQYLNDFYIQNYGKLIPTDAISNPNLIPLEWNNRDMQSIDNEQKKRAIKAGFQKWINWEEGSLKAYENAYANLMNMRQVQAASFINKYITDVSEQLYSIKNQYLNQNFLDYDLNNIINSQKEMYDYYAKKI